MPYVLRRRRGFGQLPIPAPVVTAAAQAQDPVVLLKYCSQGWANWLTAAGCWSQSPSTWETQYNQSLSAAPPAPPQSVWTTAPASGEQAAATVQDVLNQTAIQQQQIDAGQVQTNIGYQAAGAAADIGESISSAASSLNPSNWLPNIPWGSIAIVAVVGVLGLAAIGSGGPRRYGR